MSERLTWDEIKERYEDEWVELIDFEWDETELNPRYAIVGFHAKNRREFDSMLAKEKGNRPKRTAIRYAGQALKLPENCVFSTSLRQYGKQPDTSTDE